VYTRSTWVPAVFKFSTSDIPKTSTIRGFSVNIGMGLDPSSNTNGPHRNKLEQITDRLENCDFACIQETGLEGDEPPALILDKLTNHACFIHGLATDKGNTSASLMIMVNTTWTIGKVLRDGSGRAMGVEMKRGKWSLLLINVLMPTNLDLVPDSPRVGSAASQLKHCEKRLIASRISDTIQSWIRPFDAYIIMGDFNETVDSTVDRLPAKARMPNAAPRCGQIHGLLNSGLVDLYRTLHADSSGFTRQSKTGDSMSRIDYTLVSPKFYANKEITWKCAVDLQHDFNDHHVLTLELSSADFNPIPAGTKARHKPWAPRLPHTGTKNAKKHRLCAAACEAVAARYHCDFLALKEQGSTYNALNRLVPKYLRSLRETAIATLGLKGRSVPQQQPVLQAIQKKINILKGMQRTITRLERGLVSPSSPAFRSLAQALTEAGTRRNGQLGSPSLTKYCVT
jgi:exonuclease III